ncbi:MAG TPA: UDP-N-acetylglucosamine 1-carboxyvinyltransferase, partial [Ilumatobacteraceae bacterium]|nr:UDP-N-acetylglucosamine 1-carboxyvinyltransferase [Ilumatobacteraceae bacterium]
MDQRSDDRIVVRNRGPLEGEIVVPGAKNSVLKLMAATVMATGTYRLTNVPQIADVQIMAELLAAIGVTTLDHGDGSLTMTNPGGLTPVAPYELVERIRASINVLGPLLGTYGQVQISMPGGDDFGSRPIDMHIRGLEAMGATFELRHGNVDA